VSSYVSYQRDIPSVDPEMAQSVDDVVRNPEAYMHERRELRRREAERYVHEQLRNADTSRRARRARRRVAS
jgi:hypothetical protein